jgi:hypothetical protein
MVPDSVIHRLANVAWSGMVIVGGAVSPTTGQRNVWFVADTGRRRGNIQSRVS